MLYLKGEQKGFLTFCVFISGSGPESEENDYGSATNTEGIFQNRYLLRYF
jgi:hypothetical protein